MQIGFVSQSGGRPHLILSWTAARSLILVRLSESAVSLRTTKAFWSWAGVMPKTSMPPPLPLRIVASAAAFLAPSPVIWVLS